MKKLFVILVTLSLVVSVIWAGTPIPGTVIAAKITTGNTDNTFSIGDTIEMLGTCKQVADNAARDAIPAERRAEGMQVWVVTTQTAWRLVGGIANGNWQVEHLALPADASGALTNDGVGNLGWNPTVSVSAVVVPGQNISITTNAGPAYGPNVVGTLTNNTTGNAATATKATYVADISTNQIAYAQITNPPSIGVVSPGQSITITTNAGPDYVPSVTGVLTNNFATTGSNYSSGTLFLDNATNHITGGLGVDGTESVGVLVPSSITGTHEAVAGPFITTNGSGAMRFSYNGGAFSNIQASGISNLRTQWSVGDITNAGNMAYSNATPNAAGAYTNNGTGTLGWYPGYAPVDAQNNFTGSNTFQGLEAAQAGATTNAWAGPTNNIDLSIQRVDYVTTTSLSVTGFVNKPTKYEHSVVLTVSNSTAVDKIMYLPAGVTTDDGQSSYTVTNQSLRIFSFRYNPNNYTNAVSRQFPGGASGGGSGTVTSVQASGPAGFTWSGGPITGSGTLTASTPGIILTNGEDQAFTLSNNMTMDATHMIIVNGTNKIVGKEIINGAGTGTTIVNLGLDSNNNVVTNVVPVVSSALPAVAEPYPPVTLGQRTAQWYTMNNTTLSSIGETLILQGSAAVAVAATSTSHRMLEYYTPAVQYNTNALYAGENSHPSSKSGAFTWVCQATNVSLANMRMWVGLCQVSFNSLANVETNSNISVIAFLGSATNWANWHFMSDDANGAHWTMTDTGVPLTTLVTNFTIVLQASGSAAPTNAIGYLNGVAVATNTANLPLQPLGTGIGWATLGSAAAGVRVAWHKSTQDQ